MNKLYIYRGINRTIKGRVGTIDENSILDDKSFVLFSPIPNPIETESMEKDEEPYDTYRVKWASLVEAE